MRRASAPLLTAIAASVFAAIAPPARASVTVCGRIQVWNPDRNRYEPLQQARVRVVLWEDWDEDTLDKEAHTDRNGWYEISKGNAWWYNGYHVYVIVFAETEYRLEVQNGYMIIDGYQAVSHETVAYDDSTKTISMQIGGPEEQNVRRYQEGGMACFDNSETVDDREKGWRAFFIFREMTDVRLYLADRHPSIFPFEEKEVQWHGEGGSRREGGWDLIHIMPSEFSTLSRASHVCRHEYGHGIMADEYWDNPDPAPEGHEYWVPTTHRQGAWSEAWAQFVAETTQYAKYGNHYADVETSPQLPDTAHPDWDYGLIEGQIASALWDIYDGVGWEKRARQVDDAVMPGEEQFYDGISDPNADKIVEIFNDRHPLTFTHGTYAGDPDSFIYYWLSEENFGQKHELKAILHNRGIEYPGRLPQHKPTLVRHQEHWSGPTVTIPITVTEPDPEDQEHVRAEIYVNGHKTSSMRLADGWQGNQQDVDLTQDIAYQQGDPKPRVVVAVHDDIEASWDDFDLDVPEGSQIGGLVAEIVGLTLRVNLTPEDDEVPDLGEGVTEGGGFFVNVRAIDTNRVDQTTRVPVQGGLVVFGDVGEKRWTGSVKVYETDDLPAELQLRFEVDYEPVEAHVKHKAAGGTFTAENLWGLGDVKTETIAFELGGASTWAWGEPPLVMEVAYRITAKSRPLQIMPAMRLAILALPPVMTGPGHRFAGFGPRRPRETRPGPGRPDWELEKLKLGGLFSRGASLAEEHARLQARATEIAAALEAKLQFTGEKGELPETSPVPRRATAARTEAAGGPQGLTLRAAQIRPDGFLALPPTKVLQDAVEGRLQVAELTPEQKADLTELGQQIDICERRLPQIGAEAAQVLTRLQTVAEGVSRRPTTNAARKNSIQSALAEAETRLGAIGPTVAEYKALLKTEREALNTALQRPATGRVRAGAAQGRTREANQAPVLEYLGQRNWVDSDVDNGRPQVGDTVRFRVRYVDPDNDAPAGLQLVITDPAGKEIVQELRPVDETDTDYRDGVAFAVAYRIQAPGRHGYRYRGSDARGAALQGDLMGARRLLATDGGAADQ